MLPGWVLRLKGASWADSGSNPWWNEVWIMTFRAWLQARSPSLYKPKRVQKKNLLRGSSFSRSPSYATKPSVSATCPRWRFVLCILLTKISISSLSHRSRTMVYVRSLLCGLVAFVRHSSIDFTASWFPENTHNLQDICFAFYPYDSWYLSDWNSKFLLICFLLFRVVSAKFVEYRFCEGCIVWSVF